MNNLTFISDKEFNETIEKGRLELLSKIKDNEQIIQMIKLDLMIDFELDNIIFLEVVDIHINVHNFNLKFKSDEKTMDLIKDKYLKKYASCEEDANNNFNIFKINRYFLLPIDFEIKMRSPHLYLDYLIESLIESIKEQIIFDKFKNEWGHNGTLFSAYLVHKENIAPLSKQEKEKIYISLKQSYF